MHGISILVRGFMATVFALIFVVQFQPAVSQFRLKAKVDFHMNSKADLNTNSKSPTSVQSGAALPDPPGPPPAPALPTIPTLPTPRAPPTPTTIPIYVNGTTLNFNASFIADLAINETRRQIIRMGLDDIHTPDVTFRFNNYTFAIGNGSIKGLANVQRTGDVIVTADPLSTSIKIRSAFSVINASSDYDIDLVTRDVNYTEGHVHADFDNVTVYQVFKFDVLTQTLTLDEFELSVGNVNYRVTGLGDRAQKDSEMITRIIAVTKGPALKIFNIAFKAAVNAALQVIRSALLAAG